MAQINARIQLVLKTLRKVEFVANIPLRNIFWSKNSRKSFKMVIFYPRKVFGSKPFEFLENSIFAL